MYVLAKITEKKIYRKYAWRWVLLSYSINGFNVNKYIIQYISVFTNGENNQNWDKEMIQIQNTHELTEFDVYFKVLNLKL